MKLNISIIAALLMLLCFSATTVFATTQLREKVGSSGSRIAKMYVENGADDEPRHVGYVIAGHWLKMFAPTELPVNL